MKPDYVFFFSYILVTDANGALEWGDERLVSQNSTTRSSHPYPQPPSADRSTDLILTNFLQALPEADALPKRIFIQFGAKHYGLHLGSTRTPDTESDPRLHLEPNFYYSQQDILSAFCSTHSIAWNASYPMFVIGAAADSNQSLLYPILIYASVQKALGKKLEWPGTLEGWWAPQALSTAGLNSRQYEWMVLSPHTGNEAFNTTDGCEFTWGKFWPSLAAWFDMPYTGPVVGEDGGKWVVKPMKSSPPPHGLGEGRSEMKLRFSFVDWAKAPENVAAWKQLSEAHGLKGGGEWQDVGSIFGRADFALGRGFASVLSMVKAKKHGWFGFVESGEAILGVAEEFVGMGSIPDTSAITPPKQ